MCVCRLVWTKLKTLSHEQATNPAHTPVLIKNTPNKLSAYCPYILQANHPSNQTLWSSNIIKTTGICCLKSLSNHLGIVATTTSPSLRVMLISMTTSLPGGDSVDRLGSSIHANVAPQAMCGYLKNICLLTLRTLELTWIFATSTSSLDFSSLLWSKCHLLIYAVNGPLGLTNVHLYSDGHGG